LPLRATFEKRLIFAKTIKFMGKKYEVYLSPESKVFYDTLNVKEQRKIDFVIDKVELNFFGDWFKKLTGSDGIWEMVVDFKGVFYRFLSFFDTEEPNDPLIIVTHGFKKKTNRTPKNEIEKAEKFKNSYFLDNLK
jgi:phage-related protein